MASYTELQSSGPSTSCTVIATLSVALVILGAVSISSPAATTSAAYASAPAEVTSLSRPTWAASVPHRLGSPTRPQLAQRALRVGTSDGQPTEAVQSPSLQSNLLTTLTLPLVVLGASVALIVKGLRRAINPFGAEELRAISTSEGPRDPLHQLRTTLSTAVVTAATIGSVVTADPALAFGFSKPTEQDIYTDAWKAVQEAFIDRSFNGLDWNKVKEEALAKPLNSREETYTAIRDTLDLLGDPFTRLLDPPQFDNIKRRLTGRLTGVGLEIVPATEAGANVMKVVDRTPDGPAFQAGIQDDDLILAVDGAPIGEDSQWVMAEKLVGDRNTKVTLTVKSPGQEPRDIELERQNVVFQQVKYGVCDGVANQSWEGKPIEHVGYVRVPSFNYSTAAEFNKALKELTQKGADGAVIDLRNNTGGSLNAAYEMANSILPSGEIVRVIGKDGAVTSAQVRGNPIFADIPVTLLVNDFTASSSEVLGAALKAAGRAAIAGEQTFGKGIIQDIKTLPDGAAVFVTKERYLTPFNEEIDKVGIQPTVAVKKELLDTKTGLRTEPTEFCADLAKEAPPLFSGKAPPFTGGHKDLDLNSLSAFC